MVRKMARYEFDFLRLLGTTEEWMLEAPGRRDGRELLNSLGDDGWQVAGITPVGPATRGGEGRDDAYLVVLQRSRP
jgi:hypothetical protein